MATYTYSLSRFKTYSKNNLPKIIKGCTLNIRATNETGSTLSNMIPVEFEEPEQKTFITYSSLNEEEVMAWVEEALGEELDAVKHGMSSYLKEQEQASFIVDPREDAVEEDGVPWLTALN